MGKPRIVKDYDKLSDEIVEQIKLKYPNGYAEHLVSFTNKDGELKKGLPFETDDYYYLVRMTIAKAKEIIDEDEDFDDDGVLKSSAKAKYEEKYDDEFEDLDLDDEAMEVADEGADGFDDMD